MGADSYPLLPMAEALACVLKWAQPLPAHSVLLEQAAGQVTAAPIVAPAPLPPFPASVKDGYAVVAADGAGEFELAGRVTAGAPAGFALRPGQVAYITTGAPLPAGADAVVQVEDTQRLAGPDGTTRVRIVRAAQPGQDVRPVGHDVAPGQVVVEAGVLLGPAEIGLAATVGAAQVVVHRRPRVGVLSTGDEVISASAALQPGQIHDSNGPMLRSAVAYAGGEAVDLGIVRDDPVALQATFDAALEMCDLIVSTGGVSMGELDLVRGLVERVGQVHFGRLLLKPGKPCTFATVEHGGATRLVFGLPGNPVSSLVTFRLLVLPTIQRLAGHAKPGLRRVQVRLADSLALDPTRPEYHRAILRWDAAQNGGAGGWLAASTGNQASSRLLNLAGANALLELPQGDGVLPAGAIVPALLIE